MNHTLFVIEGSVDEARFFHNGNNLPHILQLFSWPPQSIHDGQGIESASHLYNASFVISSPPCPCLSPFQNNTQNNTKSVMFGRVA